MRNQRLLIMMEIAVLAAVAFVCSQVTLFRMPQGGAVSLVMAPIALIALRRGWVAGVLTGLIVGEFNHLLGGYVVHPIQLLLDYPLAFAALGLTGLMPLSGFDNQRSRIKALWSALFVGAAGRLACHFVSGVVWFGEYAPAGTPVAVYSFLYNIAYLLPEMIIAGIMLTAVLSSAPQLLLASRTSR